MVGRIIDVHGSQPDWLLAELVKRLDRGGETERRDTDLLDMTFPSLVSTGEFRGRLYLVAYPEPGASGNELPAGGERLILAAEQLDEKITVHPSNLPAQFGDCDNSRFPVSG